MRLCVVLPALGLICAESLSAQCPNGSPPPCASARRAPAPPPAPAARARRFLLLPFRNVTRKPNQDWLVEGAPLMLAQSLGQFSDLEVVPEERLAAARRKLALGADAATDATQLRTLAEETGGWTAITGNIFSTGDGLRITVQSMDAATARVIVRAETQLAVTADPRAAFDALTAKLLEPTGVPPGSSLASITTRSLEAYRAYAHGLELYQRSRYREAEAEFMTAVRLDSTFALAWGAISATAVNTRGLKEITNPTSYAYQAIERAARFSDRLGPRDAKFVRAIHAMFRGERRRAHRQLDSLLLANPYDVDVAFWVAAMQVLGPMVDTTVTPPRLETSMTRVVRLTEMILEHDPARRIVYVAPLMLYGLGAGLWWADIFGHKKEFSNFGAALMADPDVREVPVVSGDTVALMRSAEFDSLPSAARLALRRRSADEAWKWAERWLAAGPNDSDAHLWAFHIAELRGDFARARQELRIADSIGVQTSLESMPGLRLSILVQTGDVETAAVLADSLLAAKQLTNSPSLRFFDRRRAYGSAAFLLTKRWDSAAKMTEAMGGPRTEPVCASLRREMAGFSDLVLSHEIRRAVMDTVSAHLQQVTANPVLLPCAEVLAKRVYP